MKKFEQYLNEKNNKEHWYDLYYRYYDADEKRIGDDESAISINGNNWKKITKDLLKRTIGELPKHITYVSIDITDRDSGELLDTLSNFKI